MANKLLKTLNFGGADTYYIDWESLKNPPFGYETPTGGDTLDWDGNTTGLVNVMGVLYHISDATPTPVTGTIGISSGGSVQTTQFNEVTDMGEGIKSIVVNSMPMVIIVPTAAVGISVDGLKFNKAGVYFRNAGGEYVASLTIDGCEDFPSLTPLDTKYLPKPLQFGDKEELYIDDNLEFELMEELGMFCYFMPTDITFTGEETVRVVWGGQEYSNLPIIKTGAMDLFGNAMLLGLEDTGEPFMGWINEGMIIFIDFTATDTVTRSVQMYITTPIKLDKKYLPRTLLLSTIGENGVDYLCFSETEEKITNNYLRNSIGSQELYISIGNTLMKPLSICCGQDYGYVLFVSTHNLSTGQVTPYFKLAFTSEFTGF